MIIDAVNRRTIFPGFIFAAFIPRVMVFGAGPFGRGFSSDEAMRVGIPQ